MKFLKFLKKKQQNKKFLQILEKKSKINQNKTLFAVLCIYYDHSFEHLSKIFSKSFRKKVCEKQKKKKTVNKFYD